MKHLAFAPGKREKSLILMRKNPWFTRTVKGVWGIMVFDMCIRSEIWIYVLNEQEDKSIWWMPWH